MHKGSIFADSKISQSRLVFISQNTGSRCPDNPIQIVAMNPHPEIFETSILGYLIESLL